MFYNYGFVNAILGKIGEFLGFAVAVFTALVYWHGDPVDDNPIRIMAYACWMFIFFGCSFIRMTTETIDLIESYDLFGDRIKIVCNKCGHQARTDPDDNEYKADRPQLDGYCKGPRGCKGTYVKKEKEND